VAALADVSVLPLFPATAIYFLGVWLRAVRWKRLMTPFAEVPTSRLFRVIVIGFAVNNLLPFRLGEVVRTFLLRHSNGVPVAATLASILLERVLDVVVLCGLLALVAILVPLDGWLAALAGLAAVVMLGSTLGLVGLALVPLSLLRATLALVVRSTSRLSARLARVVESFLDGIGALRTARDAVTIGALSVGCWLGELGLYYFVMLAFGFDSGILSLIAGMVAANLATILPSSPGYVGTFDVPLQSTLSDSFGVNVAVAAGYTLLAHALLFVPVVLVGLFFLGREDLSLRALGRGRVRSKSAPPTARAGSALSENDEVWV
jgi:uncharacterized protein (TIRG00374 family)